MGWIYLDRSWIPAVESRCAGEQTWGIPELQQLAWKPIQQSIRESKQLQILQHIQGWQPLTHQIETARRVLFEMRGRAILADEVGMGKTIEAGLVLAEMLARGHLQRALILVPASLVMQWTRELNQKFQIPAQAYRKAYMWKSTAILVSTLETAKREPHRSMVLEQAYDLIIVDEAHKLKNAQSANYLFLNQIRRRGCLLLTATPLQNEMKELFHLVSLVRPGQFQQEEHFRKEFTDGKRLAKNTDQLRAQLEETMIRNDRNQAGITLPDRFLHVHSIRLNELERNLYDAVSDFVFERAHHCQMKNEQLSLMTIQREVCSSRDALFVTLVRWFSQLPEDSPLRARIWQLVQAIKEVKSSAKSKHVLNLLGQSNEKTVIFTAYRATQEHLIDQLRLRGVSAVAFYGKMKKSKRDWMLDLFKGPARVLVATDAGSEGLNIQWCNQIIHYDLPWNPMRLEQRNGRVHRIGQNRDVQIHYLLIEQSIETYMWQILSQKSEMIANVLKNTQPILPERERETWQPLLATQTDTQTDTQTKTEIETKIGTAPIMLPKTFQWKWFVNWMKHTRGL